VCSSSWIDQALHLLGRVSYFAQQKARRSGLIGVATRLAITAQKKSFFPTARIERMRAAVHSACLCRWVKLV
jgi:hypothetical protein